jgi:hypothetical protein
MIPIPESICPLCSQVFPSELLREHINSEHPRLRHSTIKVIQAYHPGWVEDHGACEPCWRSYREASRMFNQMKSAKPKNPPGSWKPAELAAQSPAKVQTGPHEAR